MATSQYLWQNWAGNQRQAHARLPPLKAPSRARQPLRMLGVTA